jgi:hypothetical protein
MFNAVVSLNSLKNSKYVLFNCHHGCVILEDDTQIIDIKNDSFMDLETDKNKF